MAANSSLISLIFNLIFYITTATSVLLYSELLPISKEVEIATEQMDLPETMKYELSEKYLNVGGYSTSFIELLDSYWTMSRSPIRFDEKEKSLLTLTSPEDSIEYKVRTQLKYYRKMQEVQCTDYFILHYHLDANCNIQHIIQHVYNMLKMAYLGNFVIFSWLLKFHVNLLTPSDWKPEASISQLNDIDQYKKSLSELVSMCVEHKYLENENSKGCSSTILEHDNFNTQLHIHFDNNISPLPFSFDNLYLSKIRQCEQPIEPITSVATGFSRINDDFQDEINTINEQLSTENWKMDPFENIEFQKMFLDIVKLKLYCFIKVVLKAYEKVHVSEYENRLDIFNRLDYFMSQISDIVGFIDIGDKILYEVLTLYSTYKKDEPCYEQNKKLLEIVKNEIDDIILLLDIPRTVELAFISKDDLKSEQAFILFLGNLENTFREFSNFLKTTLDGFPLNCLLFFYDGSYNTELAVFP